MTWTSIRPAAERTFGVLALVGPLIAGCRVFEGGRGEMRAISSMCVKAPVVVGVGLDVPRPGVDPGDLETVVPAAGVGALALGTGAYPVSVGLAVLPAAAEGAAVVEVEPAAVHVGSPGRARRAQQLVTGTLGQDPDQLAAGYATVGLVLLLLLLYTGCRLLLMLVLLLMLLLMLLHG